MSSSSHFCSINSSYIRGGLQALKKARRTSWMNHFKPLFNSGWLRALIISNKQTEKICTIPTICTIVHDINTLSPSAILIFSW